VVEVSHAHAAARSVRSRTCVNRNVIVHGISAFTLMTEARQMMCIAGTI